MRVIEKPIEGLDWPSGTVEMARQWIGYSEGASLNFGIKPGAGSAAAKAGGMQMGVNKMGVFPSGYFVYFLHIFDVFLCKF